MSGAVNASFSYDGLGRRTAKTVNGVTTAYVYDGLNFVQEKSAVTPGAAVTANLLTGLGLDETFLRMSGSGAGFNIAAFLPDANNTTIYTTNRYYSVVENHSYEPYGAVTHLGMDDNTQLYTGRENDESGLYYYRARYYHPTFGRFISEDPIGFAAGPNLYAYVDGDPVNLNDPLGLQSANSGAPRQSQNQNPQQVNANPVQQTVQGPANFQQCVQNSTIGGGLAGACVALVVTRGNLAAGALGLIGGALVGEAAGYYVLCKPDPK